MGKDFKLDGALKKNYQVIDNIPADENINEIKSDVWKIEIPSINLDAKIAEGTEPEILDEFVGHFEETQKENGNVGLAAHNRGYKVNYFQNLKLLEIGDEIHYYFNGIKRTYLISDIKIIEDTDWTSLENTNDNRVTLITCVENKPNYRLCVQGIERAQNK